MTRLKLTFVLLLSLIGTLARAEYRAFELRIADPEKGTERTVRSTLDHLQYPEYFPLTKGEQIQLLRSWRCWGNTGGFKPICPAPDERTGQEVSPAAEPRTSSAS